MQGSGQPDAGHVYLPDLELGLRTRKNRHHGAWHHRNALPVAGLPPVAGGAGNQGVSTYVYDPNESCSPPAGMIICVTRAAVRFTGSVPI